MARSPKMPLPVLLALTIGPALAIGATLWVVNDLVPACTVAEQARVSGPHHEFDLVVFSRDCGDRTGPNTQAALIPFGDPLPDDAAAFLQIAAKADVHPGWSADGEIEITLPPDTEIARRDETVAGIDVIYH